MKKRLIGCYHATMTTFFVKLNQQKVFDIEALASAIDNMKTAVYNEIKWIKEETE